MIRHHQIQVHLACKQACQLLQLILLVILLGISAQQFLVRTSAVGVGFSHLAPTKGPFMDQRTSNPGFPPYTEYTTRLTPRSLASFLLTYRQYLGAVRPITMALSALAGSLVLEPTAEELEAFKTSPDNAFHRLHTIFKWPT